MSTQKEADALWARLKTSLLGPAAEAPAALRQAAFVGPASAGLRTARAEPLAAHISALVDKVHRHAYKLTDEDVQTARAAGLSEAAIYELIVIAAVGAATHRLQAGLAVLAAPASKETDHAS